MILQENLVILGQNSQFYNKRLIFFSQNMSFNGKKSWYCEIVAILTSYPCIAVLSHKKQGAQ